MYKDLQFFLKANLFLHTVELLLPPRISYIKERKRPLRKPSMHIDKRPTLKFKVQDWIKLDIIDVISNLKCACKDLQYLFFQAKKLDFFFACSGVVAVTNDFIQKGDRGKLWWHRGKVSRGLLMDHQMLLCPSWSS